MYEVGGIKSIRFEDSIELWLCSLRKVINPLPEVNQLHDCSRFSLNPNDSNVANLHSITTSQNTNTPLKIFHQV